MKKLNLKKLVDELNWNFKSYVEELDLGSIKIYSIIDDIFDINKVEDRDVILEDIDKDNGLIYKMIVDFNENKEIIDNDLVMVWYEYSLEDLIRDSLEEYFEIKDINDKVYGKGNWC